MTERVVFLDIDGPIIPNGMFLIDRNCSFGRNIPAIPVAIVKAVCERAGAKVVFNTTHNKKLENVDDIDVAMVKAGLPQEMIHEDKQTTYPWTGRRMDAVEMWLEAHPEVKDWIAFDDAHFTAQDNLIWVDPDAGLHVEHLNKAMDRWSGKPFIIY